MEFVFLAIVFSSFELCYGGPVKSQDSDANTLPLTKLGNKCYYVQTIAKENWYAANYFCNFHGMHLASIQSEAENTALGEHVKTLERLPHEQRIWTSGSQLSREGIWYWSSIGRRVTYANWMPGQPDNPTDEHCLDVALVDGKLGWNNLECWKENPYICEVTC